MPTNKLVCPSCKSVLETAKPIPPGSAVRCTKCRQVFTVPAVTVAAQVATAPRKQPPMLPRPSVEAAKPKRSVNDVPQATDKNSKTSSLRKALLIGGGCLIVVVGIVLGVVGKSIYDRFSTPKKVARVAAPVPSKEATSPAPDGREKPTPAPNATPPKSPAVPEGTEKPNRSEQPSAPKDPAPISTPRADAARIKITNPRFTKPAVLNASFKYEPDAHLLGYVGPTGHADEVRGEGPRPALRLGSEQRGGQRLVDAPDAGRQTTDDGGRRRLASAEGRRHRRRLRHRRIQHRQPGKDRAAHSVQAASTPSFTPSSTSASPTATA